MLLSTFANVAIAQQEQPAFALLEIEVVDTAGNPLPEVAIDVELDRLEFPIQPDEEGIATLNLTPDSPLEIKFSLDGYLPQQVVWSRGDKIPAELKVEMQKGLPLGGTVRDEQGQPIEGVEIVAQTKTRGLSRGKLQIKIDGVIAETDNEGRWEAQVGMKENPHLRMGIIAKNSYISRIIPRVNKDDYQLMRKQQYDVTLQTRKPPSGTILDAQGNPVAEAEIYVTRASRRLHLANGRAKQFIDTKTMDSIPLEIATKTDVQGSFSLPIQPDGFSVACIHDQGWAEVPGVKWDENRPIEIQLTPWARLEGSVQLGGKLIAGDMITMHYMSLYGRDRFDLDWTYVAHTDEKGEFVLDRIVPGNAFLVRKVDCSDGCGYDLYSFSHGRTLKFIAGETQKVTLGGTGREVIGKRTLEDPGNIRDRIYGRVTLLKHDVVGSFAKTALYFWGRGISQSTTWPPQQTPTTTPRKLMQITYATGLSADGSFRIQDVPPGTYQMHTAFYDTPTNGEHGDTLAIMNEKISILETGTDDEGPFDLGENSIGVNEPATAPAKSQ